MTVGPVSLPEDDLMWKPRPPWRGRTGRERGPHRDPDEIRHTAVHEAAHAVAAVVHGTRLHSVDLRRRTMPAFNSLGYTRTEPVTVGDIAGKGGEVAMPLLVQLLAGPFAEAGVNPASGGIGVGPGRDDMAEARRVAVVALCDPGRIQAGEGRSIVAPDEMERLRPRFRKLMDDAVAATARFAEEYRDAIDQVAGLLVDRRELTGDEVAAIVRGIAKT
jgi:hypothetical protein